MRRIDPARQVWKVAVGLSVGGMLLGSSCSTAEIEAVLTGLEVVASQLEDDNDDDISFGDWLRDELEDL